MNQIYEYALRIAPRLAPFGEPAEVASLAWLDCKDRVDLSAPWMGKVGWAVKRAGMKLLGRDSLPITIGQDLFVRAEVARASIPFDLAAEKSDSSSPIDIAALLDAVEALPELIRQIIHLSYWEDMGDKAIARKLGLGRGRVASLRKQAARTLSKKLT